MLASLQRTLARTRLVDASRLLPMAPLMRSRARRPSSAARAGGRAGKGFGSSSPSSVSNGVSGEDSGEVLPEDILAYRQVQMRASKTLETLLQAPDTAAAAKENINFLDQNFFAVADGYLNMAKKEGTKDVVALMERVIKAAMEAKQSSLRPEIQLLNKLIAMTEASERQQMLSQADTKAVLQSDGGYFFALLDRFAQDMEAQPAANPHRDILLEQLKNIKEQANAAVA